MNWKRFTTFTISILLIICAEQLVHACADGPDAYDEYPSFFFNNINGTPQYAPFYYTTLLTYYTEGYDYSDMGDSALRDQNSIEWYNYIDKSATVADIDSFMYSANYDDVNNLYTGKEKKKDSQSTFTKWLVSQKDKEALNYLVYAKKCEPNARAMDGHWDSKTQKWMVDVRDTAAMETLVNEGLNQYKTVTKDFIKWRYIYQVLRMAFYSGKYQQTLLLYKELAGDNKYNGIMYARCLGLKAGALFKLNQKTEAAYLYSRVFDLSNELKESALISFNWALEGKTDSVLTLCTNNHEKAVVYIMDGLYEYGGQEKEGLSLMEKAYQTDPSVAGLNILMTREMNKAEDRYLQMSFTITASIGLNNSMADYYSDIKKSRDSVARTYNPYLNRLNTFAQKVADDGKNGTKAFWHLASAYIYFMEGNQGDCKKYLDIAQKENMTNIEHDVHDVIYALYTIHSNGKITAKTEADLLPSLKWVEQRSKKNKRFVKVYNDLMTSVLSTAYLKQGDTIKAIYCLSRINSDSAGNFAADLSFANNPGILLETMDANGLHKVEDYVQQPNKTDFDKWLTNNPAYSFSVLRELEGTKYIRQMQFDKATAVLQTVSKNQLPAILPDFLVSHLQDSQDWNKSDSANNYSKLDFARKMAELQQKVNSNPIDGRSAYQYANGLYNMSYYGKANGAFAYYRGGTDENAYLATDARKKLPLYQQEYYNVQQAQKYYLQAYKNNTSPEMKARCLFLAAKCWQKNCPQPKTKDKYYYYYPYMNMDYYYNSLKNPYFKQLVTGYKNTKFYGEVYNTCSYLQSYVKKDR